MGDAVSPRRGQSERALSVASKCRDRAERPRPRSPAGSPAFVSDGALDRPSKQWIHHQFPGTKGHRHIDRFLAGSTNRLYVSSTVVSPLERTGSHPDRSPRLGGCDGPASLSKQWHSRLVVEPNYDRPTLLIDPDEGPAPPEPDPGSETGVPRQFQALDLDPGGRFLHR